MAGESEKGKHGKWGRLRRVVQVLSLLSFLVFLFGTRTENGGVTAVDVFFHLDPLVAISAMVASRSWMAPAALALVTVVLTILVGRAWCGWVCPLGTLIDWTPSRRARPKRLDISTHWRQAKNVILFTVVLSAIAGNLALLFLDPITILYRTFASVVAPLANSAVTATEGWLYRFALLRPGLEWSDAALHNTALTYQPFYLPSLLIALLFAGVLALNAIRARFWCRYLCPLGALLGLVSRISVVRRVINGDKCTGCYRCAIKCPTAAIKPDQGFLSDTAECTTCMDCMEVCPKQAISFGRQPVLPALKELEPSRRQFLISAVVAVVAAAALRGLPALARTTTPLVRPPGADEDQLLSRCIRCGQCARVCPTGVIQLSAASPDGLWMPMMATRTGYCDYSCNACGQVCPTGAITMLALPEKQRAVIGRAEIDEKRCIPFAEGRECIVCEEMCPIPEKAIVLEEKTVLQQSGEPSSVRQPRVIRRLCTGCGICECRCPLDGEAAIKVYPDSGDHGAGPGSGQGQGRGKGSF